MMASGVAPDYIAVSGEPLVASPRDNGPSNIPEFGHIVLDSHQLPLVEAVRLSLLCSDRDLLVFRLSVLCRWVGMWARPGTLKVLCRNNSAGDPEPSVLWS